MAEDNKDDFQSFCCLSQEFVMHIGQFRGYILEIARIGVMGKTSAQPQLELSNSTETVKNFDHRYVS